jgi:hypothetical protein
MPVCIFREKRCQYEIQEQKEVPVWYTGIYRPILSTGYAYDAVTVLVAHVVSAAYL